jgi:hypothetical protein
MLPPKSMRSGPSSTSINTASAWDAQVSRRMARGCGPAADADRSWIGGEPAISISCRSPAYDIADQYNAVFRFQSKNDAP